jgi:hypothetical protein
MTCPYRTSKALQQLHAAFAARNSALVKLLFVTNHWFSHMIYDDRARLLRDARRLGGVDMVRCLLNLRPTTIHAAQNGCISLLIDACTSDDVHTIRLLLEDVCMPSFEIRDKHKGVLRAMATADAADALGYMIRRYSLDHSALYTGNVSLLSCALWAGATRSVLCLLTDGHQSVDDVHDLHGVVRHIVDMGQLRLLVALTELGNMQYSRVPVIFDEILLQVERNIAVKKRVHLTLPIRDWVCTYRNTTENKSIRVLRDACRANDLDRVKQYVRATTDAASPIPLHHLLDVICEGDSLEVFNYIYTAFSIASDTLAVHGMPWVSALLHRYAPRLLVHAIRTLKLHYIDTPYNRHMLCTLAYRGAHVVIYALLKDDTAGIGRFPDILCAMRQSTARAIADNAPQRTDCIAVASLLMAASG